MRLSRLMLLVTSVATAGRTRSANARIASRLLLVVICIATLAAGKPARAEWQRVYQLKEVIERSTAILRLRVVGINLTSNRFALQTVDALRGKAPFTWVDADPTRAGWMTPPVLLGRLQLNQYVIGFVSRMQGRFVMLMVTEGSWFQLTAPLPAKDLDHLDWTVARGDPFLHRTFPGRTRDLEKIIRAVQAGTAAAPPADLGSGVRFGTEGPSDYLSTDPLPLLPPAIAKHYKGPAVAITPAELDRRYIASLKPLQRAEIKKLSEGFNLSLDEAAGVYRSANANLHDAWWALSLMPNYGSGGQRAYVRTPAEFLRMKHGHSRLTWLDLRGCLMRAGDLFRPVDDSSTLLADLRQRFTWPEIDPLLGPEKYTGTTLDDALVKLKADRRSAPLLPGEVEGPLVLSASFGQPLKGEPSMESIGWMPCADSTSNLPRRQFKWSGTAISGDSAQAPGGVTLQVPDCCRWDKLNVIANIICYAVEPDKADGRIPNVPPTPGIPLGEGRGIYNGSSLWVANGIGDLAGANVVGVGAAAQYSKSIPLPKSGIASYLITLQLFAPDHTEEVGEPRWGGMHGRETSRFIVAGVRITDSSAKGAEVSALGLDIEPAPDRFDRIQIRVDTAPDHVTIIGFLPGVGQVARRDAAVDLSRGLQMAPWVGTGRPLHGYTPEFYLAAMKVTSIVQIADVPSAAPPAAHRFKPKRPLHPVRRTTTRRARSF